MSVTLVVIESVVLGWNCSLLTHHFPSLDTIPLSLTLWEALFSCINPIHFWTTVCGPVILFLLGYSLPLFRSLPVSGQVAYLVYVFEQLDVLLHYLWDTALTYLWFSIFTRHTWAVLIPCPSQPVYASAHLLGVSGHLGLRPHLSSQYKVRIQHVAFHLLILPLVLGRHYLIGTAYRVIWPKFTEIATILQHTRLLYWPITRRFFTSGLESV